MTTSLPAFDQLFHHEHFVRQALRGLLRDPDAVDDAVQETWLRTLQHPPGAGASTDGDVVAEPRTWLARVAHNLAVTRWRAERRRAARERVVAAGAGAGETESADASRRRVEMRQQVVAAILALDEPYRSVVLLRYEEGMPLTAIATRLGRSAATVRSQLSRAHDQLRHSLDRDFGGRERWAGLAAALVGETAVVPGAGAGALVVVGGTAALLAVAWLGAELLDADPALPAAASPVAAVASSPEAAASPTPTPDTTPARETAVPGHDPAQDPVPTFLRREAAELFDRQHYLDYELATFSFEHGLRDDPGLAITHNDWDVLLERNTFRVRLVTDDRSAIVDLGALDPAAFGALAVARLEPRTDTPVLPRHTYFIGTCDDDTTLATVLFVREHVSSRRVRFDWFTTDGTGNSQGSIADPGIGKPWTEVLAQLWAAQRSAQDVGALVRPHARLQLRGGGNGGGNGRRIDLTGANAGYVDARSATPLDVVTPPALGERCESWADGGTVPIGSVFVVTRIEYAGGARGDANGRGAFRVVVNGKDVVDLATTPDPIAGVWTGRLEIENGAEADTWFEIANSSWGEVRLSGQFVAGAGRRGFGGRNAGFGRVPEPRPDTTPVMTTTELRLQIRTGDVGGNPCRIDLRGREGLRIDRVATAPLDFAAPLADGERCVVFVRGGKVPPGKVFVVDKVRWTASVGDGAGSPCRLVVGGTEAASVGAPRTTTEGEWLTPTEIAPGEETRTFVEIGNGSHADVVITGHFEQR